MVRRISPAADRNLPPILDALERLLPPSGLVLEVASGPGQHLAAFARAFPALTWQGSDVDAGAIQSTAAWLNDVAGDNVHQPLPIDLSAPRWHENVPQGVSAVLAINLCHIAPWAATAGLIEGAACLLPAGGPLLVYGPFMRDGMHTAPSNASFDRTLRAGDPALGVRDLADLDSLAVRSGFAAACWHEMPANNALLEFRREASP